MLAKYRRQSVIKAAEAAAKGYREQSDVDPGLQKTLQERRVEACERMAAAAKAAVSDRSVMLTDAEFDLIAEFWK